MSSKKSSGDKALPCGYPLGLVMKFLDLLPCASTVTDDCDKKLLRNLRARGEKNDFMVSTIRSISLDPKAFDKSVAQTDW